MTEEHIAALEEMESERDKLEESLASINIQIENARQDRFVTGEYADPSWWKRVHAARTLTARKYQALQRRIGALRRERRRTWNNERERAFISVAKRVLSQETYEHIWEEVESMPGLSQTQGAIR